MNKRQLFATALTAAAASVATGYSGPGVAQNKSPGKVKLVFTLHRRPGMNPKEFREYWRTKHAPIGAALPGVRKYIQNHAGAALDGSPPPFDGYSELWFDDMESLQRALTSPEGQAAVADSQNFLDMQ